MGSNTRVYNKFEFWSVADCACEHCQFFAGKNRPCPLEVCCCEDIRAEAIRREQATNVAYTDDVFVAAASAKNLLQGGLIDAGC